MPLPPALLRPAAAAIILFSLSACADLNTPSTGSQPCFSSNQWRGWTSPEDDVIYIRVRTSDIWRIDLLPGTGRHLNTGGRFLISQVRGSRRICTANDMQLSLSDARGFRTPLFPRTLRRLTPEEAAALPPGSRP